MRKILFPIVFLLIPGIIFCQAPSGKYSIIIKKADTFYRQKNYKSSALTYSMAFKLNKGLASHSQRLDAACSWALNKVPDSAFAQLNIIGLTGFANPDLLKTNKDLIPLHKDKRWKPLLEIISENNKRKEAKLNKPLILELDTIFTDDQSDRLRALDYERNFGAGSKEAQEVWNQIRKKDSINLIKIEAILSTYGWPGPDVIGVHGRAALFLVIQHAEMKIQEKYLPIMMDAVKDGRARPADLALLEDRLALRHGKKQIYGSQIIKDGKTGRDTMAPIEDYARVDLRRAAVGLEPLSEYVMHWGIILSPPKKSLKSPDGFKYGGNDFKNALEISDSVVGPTNVWTGTGKVVDFKAMEPYEEQNSAWYKFTIPYDTLLTFDIVPNDPADDLDFILFKCLSADCGEQIRTNALIPDRECFSQNFDKSASTGLSEYSIENYLGGGAGPGYVAALPVKAGETCYLMVNFPKYYHRPAHGFYIYFYNYWKKKPREEIRYKITKRNKSVKKPVVLENVEFKTNTATLEKESSLSLDKLANQLQTDRNIKIEVMGHTDNIGDERKNQKLSEERAQTVVNYLVSKKVAKERISFTGYGSQKPRAPNDTEQGRRLNRRVEFRIK